MKYIYLSILFIIFSSLNFEDFDTEKLEKESILYQSAELSKLYSGKAIQWKYEYGLPKPRKVCEKTSIWLDCYPRAFITEDGKTTIETMGDPKLWDKLVEIGIDGVHTNPMKIAGGIITGKKTPSVDGGYDRISVDIDPQFGTKAQYIEMAKVIHNHKSIIIGDLIPGHTGLGADFVLALKNFKDYPGLYAMVEIDKKDWDILPSVTGNNFAKNLNFPAVDKLKEKGYIVGRLERVIFASPGVKVTNWDATKEIIGVDGKKRRWVYLHYFKAGQPSLNWLDPTFAANRLVAGDAMESMHVLKNNGLRLDANGFLGLERRPGKEKAWSEGHPLSVVSTNLISMLVRKLGGFTFQELNLTVPDMKTMLKIGADLSYDFITRTAYCHAIMTGDADFLRLNLALMNKAKISPIRFIHALQNHDEITYELVHFEENADKKFEYKGKQITGLALRKEIIKEDFPIALKKKKTPYVIKSGNGLCTTMIGLCAAAMGVNDIYSMSPKQKFLVKKAHLLLTFFNAMQPGVFMLSGWDLVGAIPLKRSQIRSRMKGGDCRWINRGAYDLLGNVKNKKFSPSKLPKALTIYGSITDQLKDPNSYASILKRWLKVRKEHKIQLAYPKEIINVRYPQLYLASYQLVTDNSTFLVALNFGKTRVREKIKIYDIKNTNAFDIISEKKINKKYSSIEFEINLEPLDAKGFIFKK